MILITLLFSLLLAISYYFGHLPLLIPLIYTAMSLLAFISFGLDKRAALHAAQRTPESRLLLQTLLGGWPGAVLGQRLFRHKRRKLSFMVRFWLMTLLNTGLLLLWLAYQHGLLPH